MNIRFACRTAATFILLLSAHTAHSSDTTTTTDSKVSAAFIEAYDMIYKHNQPDKALEMFNRLAADGVADAQSMLGIMYESGIGTTPDLKKSLEWRMKAAAQGEEQAQYDLGLMYQMGKGVKSDMKKAIKWFEASANGGHPAAMCALADQYAAGIDIKKDMAKARRWYIAAVEKDYEDAYTPLGMSYYLEYKDTSDRNLLEKAMDHFRLAIDNEASDTSDAQYFLAMCLIQKYEAENKDFPDEVYTLLRQAAAGGNEYASYYLSILSDPE